jgi:hypothetical protein
MGLLPSDTYDEGGWGDTIAIWQVVSDGEGLSEQLVYLAQVAGPYQARPRRMQRWERYVEAYGLSETCAKALVVAGKTPANLTLANGQMDLLKTAANAAGIDWKLLAAIGVRESGFMNKDERKQDGTIGNGRGVFQIDLSQNRGVTEAEANDVAFAANWAATTLAGNAKAISGKLPGLSAEMSIWMMVSSYNTGVGGQLFRFNAGYDPDWHTAPVDAKKGIYHNNYGRNVLGLKDCF